MGSHSVTSVAAAPAARWYAVQAQPRREMLAQTHLRNQHFAAFCPVRRKMKRIGRHIAPTFAPFFPGYLFVQLDLEHQRWRSVNGTIGVIRLVGSGTKGELRPTALPEGLIEHFQKISADMGELRLQVQLTPGDAVRVTGGPFDQLCGTLESAGDLERVTILLEILSKQTRVRLSRDMLVAA